MIGDRVVSGSRYAAGGERCVRAELPGEVAAFAEAMLADVRWRPGPIFMLDVCESDGSLWLVELNNFSGSWEYEPDLCAVVGAASELAERNWRESAASGGVLTVERWRRSGT